MDIAVLGLAPAAGTVPEIDLKVETGFAEQLALAIPGVEWPPGRLGPPSAAAVAVEEVALEGPIALLEEPDSPPLGAKKLGSSARPEFTALPIFPFAPVPGLAPPRTALGAPEAPQPDGGTSIVLGPAMALDEKATESVLAKSRFTPGERPYLMQAATYAAQAETAEAPATSGPVSSLAVNAATILSKSKGKVSFDATTLEAATSNVLGKDLKGRFFAPDAVRITFARPLEKSAPTPEPGFLVETSLIDALSEVQTGSSFADDEPKDSGGQPLMAPPSTPEKASTVVHVATEETLPALQQERVMRQVADRIELLAAARPREGVVIRLEPYDLGEVTLVLSRAGSEIEAKVYADNEGVRNALTESKGAMVSHLERRGIVLGNLEVAPAAEQGRTASGAGNPHANHQPPSSKNAALREHLPPMEASPAHAHRRPEGVRSASGVDVWI